MTCEASTLFPVDVDDLAVVGLDTWQNCGGSGEGIQDTFGDKGGVLGTSFGLYLAWG